MNRPMQGTVKPRRPTKLATTDLHWLWWLNVRSLNLLDPGLAEVPYLWPEEDGKRLRLYLEPVSEEEGMSVWSYTNPIDYAATLMVLLAKAEDEFPDFDPERPPETPMSPHLRWAVQRALEDHALHRIVCYPRVKSVSVRCELQGWDGRWFERSELYTRGVHQEAGMDLHAIALAGDLPDLYMREGPLPDVLEWLTYAAASYEREDWAPWDGDERTFTAKWTRGPCGVWRRWLRIYQDALVRAEGEIHRRSRSAQKPATRPPNEVCRKHDSLPWTGHSPSRPHHRFARRRGRSGLKLKSRYHPPSPSRHRTERQDVD